MSTTERVLAPTERRFVPKQQGLAKSSPWAVYDRQRASFPNHLIGLGIVNQPMKAGDDGLRVAQAEADRLEGLRDGR